MSARPDATDISSRIPAPRLIGWIRGSAPGPMLLAIGGLHGNEPEGLAAMRAVRRRLEGCAARMHGDVVMLAGNLRALSQGRRFLTRDLNRGWSAERLSTLRQARPGSEMGPEDHEQLELAAALDVARDAARGVVHVVDLHSTSAEGIPFVTTTEGEDDCAFARLVPLPLVFGLLEAVGRTVALYLKERGCTVLAVEGGLSGCARSAENLEAALWLLLVGAGILDADCVDGLESHRERLERSRGDLPRAIQVHHRHAVHAADGFCMEPRFANLQRISRGQLLARDRKGEIRATTDGFLVLPVYQPQGDDGFFLGTERKL